MPKRRREHSEQLEEDEPYVPSDSEEEYSDSEKILLERARKAASSDVEDSEEEVFGVGGDSSDDEEEEEEEEEEEGISDSDIEGKENDDNLPDARAWGKKKHQYYSTDYVDKDYGGFDEKDAEAAAYEEQEAREIQKRLTEQLDDADFSLDLFTKKASHKEKEVEKEKEVIKTDLTKLSKRQKLVLLEKESPEFFGLVEDFKANMTELSERLYPILQLIREGKIPQCPATTYIETKHKLAMNYCTNIAFYLLLKARRIPVQSHPVIRRLNQYHQLIKQLEPIEKQIMAAQIDAILEKLKKGEEISTKTDAKPERKHKLLKLLDKNKKNKPDKRARLEDDVAQNVEETEVNIRGVSFKEVSSEDSSQSDKDENVTEKAAEAVEDGKRAITYQIAKNKGLTPHRKKEQRNPRVKHRNKFHKAVIRRKGQIREPRKEVERYGGEISGIKIGVTKSIKLK